MDDSPYRQIEGLARTHDSRRFCCLAGVSVVSKWDPSRATSDRGRHALMINRALIIAFPLLAGGVFWIGANITTTAHHCSTGSGASIAELCTFLVPVLLAPAGVIVHARLSRLKTSYAVIHAANALAIALIGIYIESWFWWSAHDCMT